MADRLQQTRAPRPLALRGAPPVVKPSPYATVYEYGGDPWSRIRGAVEITPHQWSMLTLAVLGLGGANLATYMLPVHDPPVAWRVETDFGHKLGVPVIVCPAMQEGQIGLLAPGGYAEIEPVLLDAEPGSRS